MTQARWLTLADRFVLGAPRAAPRYVARGAMGEIWTADPGGAGQPKAISTWSSTTS